MTQEVRVMLQLTLNVDATLSKWEIEKAVISAVHFEKDGKISHQLTDIIEIREEAEIYGTEE